MLRGWFAPRTFLELRRLALQIRYHRRRTLLAGNQWAMRSGKAKGPIALAKALDLIVIRNGLEPGEARLLQRVVQRVIRNIPAQIRQNCSFRLVKNARFLSVNAGNHLLFRTPAYSDDGTRQDADLFLIWPQDTRISVVSRRGWPRVSRHRFAAIPCFNIDLSFQEALSLQANEWQIFARACQHALFDRRTRSWVSNVRLP